jgi:hypothetical protein
MMRTKSWLVACALLALAAAGASHAATVLKGGVVGNGATPATGVTGPTAKIYGTAGQAVIGNSAGVAGNLCHGFWCYGGVRVLSIDDGPGGARVPTTLEFGPPTPNPTVGPVAIALALPHAAEVRVDVFDISGRVVGAMHAGHLDAGYYHLAWDGTDGDGHTNPSGVYFARLLVDGRLAAQRRVVRLR